MDLPGVTLFHAEQLQQQFARHSHEEYALGVITSGVLGFHYRREYHRAGAGELSLVIPGEAHTGEPTLGDHWSYRMFYLRPGLLQDVAQQLGRTRAPLPFFRAGVIANRRLATTLTQLHHDLEAGLAVGLESQSRLLALLARWIRCYSEARPDEASRSIHSRSVMRVRDVLEDRWNDQPTLDELARLVELSPYQLLRAFARQYGLPPHAYLLQRQLREARRLLDCGLPIAHAAVASGFADQSHLHRHFKRAWGLTPGQYRNFVQAQRR